MSVPRIPVPAKLVVGALMLDQGLFPDVAKRLVDEFGPVDMASPWFPFLHTGYYESEFGGPLFRRFLAFAEPVEQDALARVKLAANRLEDVYGENGCRRVNLDPGILTAERFVLATGKNFTHRIYLTNGIFADLTLVFGKGTYQPLAWTYPDYREENLIAFLLQVRMKYMADRAGAEPPMEGKKP
ncbi:MAG: DUF4416 family protein [Proteobacteria bacterium]|nr:DUF4416 family protein [Pseudomonadota bacterium]